MKNSDSNKPRKAHDINSRIEEEDLWDLENDWDDDASPEPDPIEKDETQAKKEDEAPELEFGNEGNSENIETQDETRDLDETPPETIVETEIEPEPKLDELPDAEAGESSVDDVTTSSDPETSNDNSSSSTGIKSDIDAIISPLKKLSLSSAEKITLVALAVSLIGLGIWGYIFLYDKNNLAETEATLDLPVKGKYATVTELSTYWISAGNAPGIKLGVAVVPVAKITLDDESSSGALRIFFRDAKKNSVGDPITISFQGGKFEDSNKTNITITDSGSSATVSATNGFQVESDFSAYQMDSTLSWKVHVLEADSSSAAGSNFEELFNTRVEPRRQ